MFPNAGNASTSFKMFWCDTQQGFMSDSSSSSPQWCQHIDCELCSVFRSMQMYFLFIYSPQPQSILQMASVHVFYSQVHRSIWFSWVTWTQHFTCSSLEILLAGYLLSKKKKKKNCAVLCTSKNSLLGIHLADKQDKKIKLFLSKS